MLGEGRLTFDVTLIPIGTPAEAKKTGFQSGQRATNAIGLGAVVARLIRGSGCG